MTLQLFAVTLLLSIPLGLAVTFLYNNKNFVISRLTSFYIMLMRGTPLLLQVFFFYYGLPFIPIVGQYLKFDAFTAASIAFTLNYAAYFAEIFRGGLLAIDGGQHEAAKVLGLSHWQTTYHIVLPQMFKVTLPAVSNEALILIKDSALVTAIGMAELLHVTKNIVNSTGMISAFAVAAVFYLLMSYVINVIFKQLEKKFSYD